MRCRPASPAMAAMSSSWMLALVRSGASAREAASAVSRREPGPGVAEPASKSICLMLLVNVSRPGAARCQAAVSRTSQATGSDAPGS